MEHCSEVFASLLQNKAVGHNRSTLLYVHKYAHNYTNLGDESNIGKLWVAY